MFTELRLWLRYQLPHHLTAGRIAAAAAALCAVLLLAPWLPPNDEIPAWMTQRHLEARGRSPAQERAALEQQRREAAQRAEQDRQAAQRREQEAQARQKEREHGIHAEAFRRLGEGHLQPIREMLANVQSAQQAIRRSASRADFYRGNVITPEETSSRRPCGDPSSDEDFLSFNPMRQREERRERNIYACAVYLATANDAPPEPMAVTVALLQRINQPELARAYPLHTLAAFAWISEWRTRLRRGEAVPRLPEMTEGESLNPALFPFLSPGFARRLYATATTEERTALARVVYPDLKRMSEAASGALAACRALQRTNCLDVP